MFKKSKAATEGTEFTEKNKTSIRAVKKIPIFDAHVLNLVSSVFPVHPSRGIENLCG